MATTKPYVHTDGRTLHLGKQPPVVDPRSLRMSKYSAALPPPPVSVDWTRGITSYGSMLNNDLGDCTCAAIGHAVQIASLNSPQGEITPSDNLILNLYEGACGYVNGDPNTDNGGIVAYVLNYVLKHNLASAKKHRHVHAAAALHAYAYINPGDIILIKQALATFGIVDIGLALPNTCQAQIGGLWSVVGNPQTDPDSMVGSWGGHSTATVAYDAESITVITWGALQRMTWEFWAVYVDEGYAMLFKSWLAWFGQKYPEALAAMEADLSLITD